MKTTATNRRTRELLTQIRKGTLEPRPEFQRRLVWSNKDKCAFLETVLLNYPFPEIYVAAGEVDVETGEAKEMLVDGQQRITTLFQYFTGSPDLKLVKALKPYAELATEEKERFLQYEVVVRDLGKVGMEQIREVFRRINATRYALNAMEIHNARYEGELKACVEELAQRPFFETHRIFSGTEVRRMQDTRFLLTVVVTLLSTYFNRDDEIEDWLKQYNDEFSHGPDVQKDLDEVLAFIDAMSLPTTSRAWKKADLFTLLVELHRILFRDKVQLQPLVVAERLQGFYQRVDNFSETATDEKAVADYYKAALQATNDRSSRMRRGEIVREVLQEATQPSLRL
jgi:Protein of unknown function DUF262